MFNHLDGDISPPGAAGDPGVPVRLEATPQSPPQPAVTADQSLLNGLGRPRVPVLPGVLVPLLLWSEERL